MTVLACPALRSDDTLGFLAALGVLELCSSTLDGRVRLGWEGLGGAALVDVPFETVEDLAAHLSSVALRMFSADRVLPCAQPGPIRKPDPVAERKARKEAGEATKLDPASLSKEAAVTEFRKMRQVEIGDPPGGEPDRDSARWLAGLVNQIGPAKGGFQPLTPLYGPSGNMSLYQLYRRHLDAVAKAPQLIVEALIRWRRMPDETGANLDTRALRDSAVTSTGKATNAAVMGATWLALMSVPLFRLVSERRSVAIGWESARGLQLRWPVWTQLLDRPAVEVLLSHPFLPVPAWTTRAAGRDRGLTALGVVAICRARRQPLSKSPGALRPPTVELVGVD